MVEKTETGCILLGNTTSQLIAMSFTSSIFTVSDFKLYQTLNTLYVCLCGHAAPRF